MTKTKRTTIDLTTHELELFAYHVSSLFRDSGSFGLSCKDGISANVVIEPSTIANNGYQPDRTPDVWDRCTKKIAPVEDLKFILNHYQRPLSW